jgi:hypothetical protein
LPEPNADCQSVGSVGFIFQNITFAVTVPLWLFLHILTSPVAKPFPGRHANSVLFVSIVDLKIFPISVILGYIIPLVLMSLPSPSIVSAVAHQRYIALWQPFPIWCVVTHMLIRSISNIIGGTTTKENTIQGPAKPLGAAYLNSAKHVYRFIIGVCLITHLPALLISLLPLSALLGSTSILQRLLKPNFAEVFVPYFPTLTHQAADFAAGVHTFLQWDIYISVVAMLLWGIFLHRNVMKENISVDPNASVPISRQSRDGMTWKKLFMKVGFWTIISGPIGALAVLLWDRDAIVGQKTKQDI